MGETPPLESGGKECPAFGTKCNHCNKDHHFEEMCRSKQGSNAAKSLEHEDSVSDTLCHVTTGNQKGANMDHHVFDKVSKAWLRRRSRSQPYIRLQMNIQREHYVHFGFSLRVPQAQSFVSAIADTGCQSCLAGLKLVKKLSVSVKDLIPVSLKMQAANNDSIRILGATIMRLSGKDDKGERRSTRQMVYVADNTDKLFLSREGCVDLGIIPDPFPTVGEAKESASESTNAIGTDDAPPAATTMPLPQTGEATPLSPPLYHSQPQKQIGRNFSSTS